MLYTVKSNVNIKTIQEEMVQKSKEVGFGVLHTYPFKEILKEKGHPITREIIVYELCNPAAAQKVLTQHPEVSIFLPCRISIYEQDGHTILSTIEMEDMTKNFVLDDILINHMSDIFNNLKKVLNSWN